MAKLKQFERTALSINIAKRRKKLGWNQSRLASTIGLHINTIKQIERGLSEGNPSTREAIANVFKCTVADLYKAESEDAPRVQDLARVVAAQQDEIEALKREITDRAAKIEGLKRELAARPDLTPDQIEIARAYKNQENEKHKVLGKFFLIGEQRVLLDVPWLNDNQRAALGALLQSVRK